MKNKRISGLRTQKGKDLVFYFCVILITFILFKGILALAVVPSESMYPTIKAYDWVIGNRVMIDVERYDVIMFRYPDDENQIFIKRVIGLPGDTVVIEDGHVDVNGIRISDSYINEKMNSDGEGTYKVPENSYFVMGDNRNHSKDSRYWKNKYVQRKKIVAEARFRVLRNWGPVR